jgi:ferric-dicitrate binding protein FerR (iron transport regulator)
MKLTYGLLFLAVASAPAAPLKEAEFTRVVNDVKILSEATTPAAAKVGDKITGRTAVSTGVQSRAELRYPDRTLTRLGANSIFRMDQGSRTVDVEKGVILLQVPKQLGGAQVRTAAVTAAITGTTVLVEHTPDGYIKIIVIEGEVDVFLNSNRRQFRTLAAGDLWITRSNDTSGLPMPVKVDLKRLRKTSKLLSEAEFGTLGNAPQIDDALNEQARLKQDGELMATAFRIEGRGRQVTLMQGERQHVLGVRTPPVRPPTAPPTPTVTERPPRAPSPEVVEPNKPVNVAESTVFDNRAVIRTVPSATAYNSSTGTFGPLPGSAYVPADDRPFNIYMYDDPLVFTDIDPFLEAQPAWFIFKGDEIYLSGDVSIDTTGGPRSLLLGATRDFRFTDETPFPDAGLAPGNTWSLDSALDALAFTSLGGAVIFDDFILTGGSQKILFRADGTESDVRLTGGPTSKIQLTEGSFEAQAGRDVLVTGTSVEASTVALRAGRDVAVAGNTVQGKTIALNAGRDAQIGSATSGGATLRASEAITIQAQQSLKITNSSQLRKLTEADPLAVSVAAANGSLDLDGGSLIDADSVNLASTRGDLRLTGSTIAAREIKARVFDTGGTLHLSNAILGRGTNPSDLIRLYGEGAGGVRFTGDTTLRGTGVDIAGTTVTIDSGSRVRLANPTGTSVFADTHNYNNRVNGNFTGLADGQAGARPVEVNKQPYANRPGF